MRQHEDGARVGAHVAYHRSASVCRNELAPTCGDHQRANWELAVRWRGPGNEESKDRYSKLIITGNRGWKPYRHHSTWTEEHPIWEDLKCNSGRYTHHHYEYRIYNTQGSWIQYPFATVVACVSLYVSCHPRLTPSLDRLRRAHACLAAAAIGLCFFAFQSPR